MTPVNQSLDRHCFDGAVFCAVLERDDRRYTVIWTPPKLSRDLYVDVSAELTAGGVAALHQHLLELDLGDFHPHTEPPMTRAKRDLIDLGMDSTERFWRIWYDDGIEHVPKVPCRSRDLYKIYREWCSQTGYPRYAPEPRFLAEIGKRSGAVKRVARYMSGAGVRQATIVFPPGVEPPPDKSQVSWLGRSEEHTSELQSH